MQKVHENKALAVKPCIAEIEILQTQNAPNRHPGLCRTKLDNISAGVKHATISATWICRPVMFTKRKRQNVTCQQGLHVPDVVRSHATCDPTVRMVLDMAW